VQLYLLPGSSAVAELARFATPHATWLLRPVAGEPGTDRFERDGDLVFLSRVDPLFAALPMLQARRAASGTSAFQPLDALLVDDANVTCSSICPPHDLEAICDLTSVLDETFYRLNCEKVLLWLRAKVDTCAQLPGISREDAVDIVSSYVGEDWADRLANFEGLRQPSVDNDTIQTAMVSGKDMAETVRATDGASLAYAEMSRSARENAVHSATQAQVSHNPNKRTRSSSGAASRNPTNQRTQKNRRNTAQAKLANADMHGVRTMTAFFTKKG
jgi:Ydr279p protein family (RNase H2 complex component) wHTH domain